MISADKLTLHDLVTTPALRAYLRNLRDWHGYIRFLGLPDRRDNPDVAIDRLFVEPLLSRRYISPDEAPDYLSDETETVFEALQKERPLVVLGDPGTGKSTLINFLVWSLSRPTERALAERIGEWRLPIPMILRELALRAIRNFDTLLEAYKTHAVCEPVRDGEYIEEMLSQGRVLLLLDGIDEIGDLDTRRHLRDAVFEGVERYPRCQWLLSSRIVGYSEVPFNPLVVEAEAEAFAVSEEYEKSDLLFHRFLEYEQRDEEVDLDERPLLDDGIVVTRYIAPFDDARIETFSKNWYTQREAATTRAGKDAAHLVRAVHADTAILLLARVPNLLTMMALIHRVEATLPHGRALLYDRIAEAYLESIDRFRGVYSGTYNLPQKNAFWLGLVLKCRSAAPQAKLRWPVRKRSSFWPEQTRCLYG